MSKKKFNNPNWNPSLYHAEPIASDEKKIYRCIYWSHHEHRYRLGATWCGLNIYLFKAGCYHLVFWILALAIIIAGAVYFGEIGGDVICLTRNG